MTPKNYGKGTPAKVAAFLRGQEEPLTVAEIAAAMRVKKRKVFDAMPALLAVGSVVRHGTWNFYRYSATKTEGDE